MNLTMLCMRSISANFLKHSHALLLLLLFLCYLENQSNPQLISLCKFLLIDLVVNSTCWQSMSLPIVLTAWHGWEFSISKISTFFIIQSAMIRSQTYKIKSLKESKNYYRWSEDIQGVLALDHCWLVTIRKKITLKVPRGLPKEKPASTAADGEIIPGITVTKEIKDAHKARIEKYGSKLLDSDDKYSRAYTQSGWTVKTGLEFILKAWKTQTRCGANWRDSTRLSI